MCKVWFWEEDGRGGERACLHWKSMATCTNSKRRNAVISPSYQSCLRLSLWRTSYLLVINCFPGIIVAELLDTSPQTERTEHYTSKCRLFHNTNRDSCIAIHLKKNTVHYRKSLRWSRQTRNNTASICILVLTTPYSRMACSIRSLLHSRSQ